MYNDTQSDLEGDIKRQKCFLIISLRFEILIRRLIVIYKNKFAFYSDRANSLLNLSNEKKYKLDAFLTKYKKFIDRLSSKLDYFIEFNKRKTNELNRLLNGCKNCFEIN